MTALLSLANKEIEELVKMKKQINDTLSTKYYSLGFDMGVSYVESRSKSNEEDDVDVDMSLENQLKREKIIESAKEDYGNIISEIYDFTNEVSVVSTKIDNEMRVLVTNRSTGKVYSRGVSKCHPDDCFNEHIGKAIAIRRALNLPTPEEYIDAPQPTIVKVGDIVTKDTWNFTKEVIGEESTYLPCSFFIQETILKEIDGIKIIKD